MKKNILIILSLFLMTVSSSCGSKETLIDVMVEGGVFSGEAGTSVPLTVNYSDTWFTKNSNEEFQASMGRLASALCVESYYREEDLSKGAQNRILVKGHEEEYEPGYFLKYFGFANTVAVDSYKDCQYETDKNDSVNLLLSHKQAENGQDIFLCAVRGSFSWSEWESGFDPGADTKEYEDLTGSHSEWTDRGIFKCYDVAKNRAAAIIDAYMKEYSAGKERPCLLITGHSKGACVAELLGAHYEDRGDVKSFTYAFNSQPVTSQDNAASYKTVFNILDTNDLLSNLFPFAEENNKRIGRNISCDVATDIEAQERISEVRDKNNYECISAKNRERYRMLFMERFPSRESLYEMQEVKRVLKDTDAAKERYEEIKAAMGDEEGLGLSPYASVSLSGKTVTFTYCGAALLRGYARILTEGESAYSLFADLFPADKTGLDIADILISELSSITAGHRLVNTYVVARLEGW